MQMPGKFMFMKFRDRLFKKRKHIRLEDMLKQLYMGESEHPGNLYMKVEEIPADILEGLLQQKWIEKKDGQIKLTDQGKEKAGDLIGKHRLYEKFLAEKTGVEPKDWHRLAEIAEHKLGPEEKEKLERELGYPLFDPHGDPLYLETSGKEEIEGKPLKDFNDILTARITHLEDEPEAIYHTLIDKGLYPGLIIRVEPLTNGRFLLKYEGLETITGPEESGLIQIKRVDEKWWSPEIIRLSLLQPGEKAKIVSLSGNLRGLSRQRLLDLGFVKGAIVETYLVAPLGEPVAYLIKGTVIALRKEQSDKILVRKL